MYCYDVITLKVILSGIGKSRFLDSFSEKTHLDQIPLNQLLIPNRQQQTQSFWTPLKLI